MSLKASAVLLPLLGLTWTLGFLAVDADGSKVMSYVFTYLFTITNSFQGVMFFVFHCLLNVDVHNAYERRYRQRKRPMSSLENTTRKSSEASTYLTDGSPTGKSTTKTNLSDMSALHRRPSVPHGRFLLFEGNRQNPYDPTHPAFDPTCPTFEPSMPALDPSHPAFDSAQEHAHSAFDAGRDVSFDNNTVSFDDPQVSDTIKIWRRSSVGARAAENSFPPTLHRSASSPTRAMAALMNSSTARPDMAAFVDSMHEVLDRPSRAAVHFT